MKRVSSDDGRLGAGLLRVALTLRSTPSAKLDPVIERIASELDIDPPALRRYLAENLAALRVAGGSRHQRLAHAPAGRATQRAARGRR